MTHKFIKTQLILGATSLFVPASTFAQKAQCAGSQAVGGTCDATSLNSLLGNVINTLFLVIGVIAVIALLIGAIRYITSTGDAKRIQQAKDTIVYAILGLIIAILARFIVGFVIARI